VTATGRELPLRLAVYVVTWSTPAPTTRTHLDIVGAAVAGGATAVQLRAPELTDDELLPVAVEVAAQCRGAGVLFIVNDRVDVAVAARAHGVHLGQRDDVAWAAGRLLPGQVLGISVRGLEDVDPALRAGATTSARPCGPPRPSRTRCPAESTHCAPSPPQARCRSWASAASPRRTP